jgi:hypothetical protein
MSEQIEALIKLLKEYKPKTAKEVRNLGYKLKQLGQGAFRTTYEIIGVDAVIKFPGGSDFSVEDGIEHSRCEMLAIKRITSRKKYTPLRRYMPVIYYHDWATGVVVAKKYQKVRKSRYTEEVGGVLNELVSDLFPPSVIGGSPDLDAHYNNLGTDRGNWIILDLGIL